MNRVSREQKHFLFGFFGSILYNYIRFSFGSEIQSCIFYIFVIFLTTYPHDIAFIIQCPNDVKATWKFIKKIAWKIANKTLKRIISVPFRFRFGSYLSFWFFGSSFGYLETLLVKYLAGFFSFSFLNFRISLISLSLSCHVHLWKEPNFFAVQIAKIFGGTNFARGQILTWKLFLLLS